MVTKSRLDSLIGQQFSATEQTAAQELHQLADKHELFCDIRQYGENDNEHVFEYIFGTYKTKVIYFKHIESFNLVILYLNLKLKYIYFIEAFFKCKIWQLNYFLYGDFYIILKLRNLVIGEHV